MTFHSRIAILAFVALTSLALAKDKNKNVLPAYVLKARTVLVMIEPDAGAPITDLTGNKKALDEVERAISKWGWLTPVQDAQTADLIITIRKGHDRIVEPTIGGGPVNDRPVVVQSTDSSVRVAGRGRQPDTSADPGGPTEPFFASADRNWISKRFVHCLSRSSRAAPGACSCVALRGQECFTGTQRSGGQRVPESS